MVSFFTREIPIPREKGLKYPLCCIIEGESFFVPETRSNRVSARLFPYRKRGWLFKTQRRKENGLEGTRIWRLPSDYHQRLREANPLTQQIDALSKQLDAWISGEAI